MMTQDKAQLLARLSVHEFLLEIVVGKMMGHTSIQEAEDFKSQILQKSNKGFSNQEISDEEFQMLASAVQEQLQHFLSKASSRADDVRKQLSQGL